MKDGPSLNDPDLWALTSACKLPEQEMPDELPPQGIPFDMCLEECSGDRKQAKLLFWIRRAKLNAFRYGELGEYTKK